MSARVTAARLFRRRTLAAQLARYGETEHDCHCYRPKVGKRIRHVSPRFQADGFRLDDPSRCARKNSVHTCTRPLAINAGTVFFSGVRCGLCSAHVGPGAFTRASGAVYAPEILAAGQRRRGAFAPPGG